MRITLIATLVLLALALPRFVVAADTYPITDADKKFLAEVLHAIHKKDVAWIAGHMSYPLSVTVSNRTYIAKSQKEFAPILSRELTDSIRAKIADAARAALQKLAGSYGWRWASVVLRVQDAGDKPWTYVIFAIGRFAFQPEDFLPPKEGANRVVYKTSVLEARIMHWPSSSSDFGLRISFGFRVSAFGFYPCPSAV